MFPTNPLSDINSLYTVNNAAFNSEDNTLGLQLFRQELKKTIIHKRSQQVFIVVAYKFGFIMDSYA